MTQRPQSKSNLAAKGIISTHYLWYTSLPILHNITCDIKPIPRSNLTNLFYDPSYMEK